MDQLSPRIRLIAVVVCLLHVATAHAVTNVFFNSSQTATVLMTNMTSTTIRSGDYLFTYSVDGYWSSYQGGPPMGRFFSVFWPTGVQAQAITAGPTAGNGADITIKRVDGKPFDLWSFTGKLLANTAGAGGAFEIMPQCGGVDAANNPLMFDATGYAGQSFTNLVMYRTNDTYKFHLWNEWAMMALTLVDTNPPLPPAVYFTTSASESPAGAGAITGMGLYASNTSCTVSATPYAGWGFQKWTENGVQVSTSANYTFTVRSNRTLVANFVPAFTVTVAAYPAIGGSATGGGTFNSNASVTVRATAVSGFQFVNWTDYGTPVSASSNYTFNISADHQFQANFAPLSQTSIFDFDTGWPTLSQGQGLPGSQSNNNLVAYFGTLGGGWSMQSRSSSVVGAPPSFSGLFLYPSTWGSTLQIQFSQPLTDFAFDFMTGELAADYDIAGTMRVTAYTNSISTTAVGTTNVQGAWIHGSYPEGHLSFHSAVPFDVVKIDMAPIATPSGLFFLDNLVAQRVVPPAVTSIIAAAASPNGYGTVSGAGSFVNGNQCMLLATPNFGYVFLNWTENGDPVCATPDYLFTVATNRSLVANFTTNTPPVAFGGTFYQLAGKPLTISIYDMIAFDYDPDSAFVSFVGASAVTTNGLTLNVDTNAMQIIVPTNGVADSFTYTIADNNGGTSTGTVTISIITSATSQASAPLNMNNPGYTVASFAGVPWYFYQAQRATNIFFTGTIRTWPVQAWADGSIYIWDDFTDLPGKPPEAYYRLISTP